MLQRMQSRWEVTLMRIAIFADVHGRLELCFRLCARWQHETGQQLDLILQAGDLGAFFDQARLDRATVRHAQRDPTELGFLHDFAAPNPRITTLLDEILCPLIFVRGNHEDHTWLDMLEQQHTSPLFPVDVYERVFCLKTGLPYTFARQNAVLTILGVGRIGARVGESDHNQSRYIQSYEQERIYQLERTTVDLLLTHDAALDFVTPGYGMEEIRHILDSFRPRYHFYGHTGKPYSQQLDPNGVTITCKLTDLTWGQQRGGPLDPGVMGILEWESPQQHSFEIVNETWLREYSRYSWRHH